MTCPICNLDMLAEEVRVTEESDPALRIVSFTIQSWLPCNCVIHTCLSCLIRLGEKRTKIKLEIVNA